MVCHNTDYPETLLLCDGEEDCNNVYHTHCVGLDAMPTVRWLCPECQAIQDLKDQESDAKGSVISSCDFEEESEFGSESDNSNLDESSQANSDESEDELSDPNADYEPDSSSDDERDEDYDSDEDGQYRPKGAPTVGSRRQLRNAKNRSELPSKRPRDENAEQIIEGIVAEELSRARKVLSPNDVDVGALMQSLSRLVAANARHDLADTRTIQKMRGLIKTHISSLV